MAKVLFVTKQNGDALLCYSLATSKEVETAARLHADDELLWFIENHDPTPGVWVWEGPFDGGMCADGTVAHLPGYSDGEKMGGLRKPRKGETFDHWCVPELRALLGGE